jgi:hypothetical protein
VFLDPRDFGHCGREVGIDYLLPEPADGSLPTKVGHRAKSKLPIIPCDIPPLRALSIDFDTVLADDAVFYVSDSALT